MMRVKIKKLPEIIKVYESYGIKFAEDGTFTLPNSEEDSSTFSLDDGEGEIWLAGRILYAEEEDPKSHWGYKTFRDCKWYRFKLPNEEDFLSNAYPECVVETLKEKIDKLIGD